MPTLPSAAVSTTDDALVNEIELSLLIGTVVGSLAAQYLDHQKESVTSPFPEEVEAIAVAVLLTIPVAEAAASTRY